MTSILKENEINWLVNHLLPKLKSPIIQRMDTIQAMRLIGEVSEMLVINKTKSGNSIKGGEMFLATLYHFLDMYGTNEPLVNVLYHVIKNKMPQ
jgi:hypothetical protein